MAVDESYVGDLLGNRPHGKGEYRYPDGTRYIGGFHNGQFDGEGEFFFLGGSRVSVRFAAGRLVERALTLADGFRPETDYPTSTDRRFFAERNEGIAPLPQTRIDARDAARTLPPGTYDTGNGFFDPSRGLVYAYDQSKVLATLDAAAIEHAEKKYLYAPRKGNPALAHHCDATVAAILQLRNGK